MLMPHGGSRMIPDTLPHTATDSIRTSVPQSGMREVLLAKIWLPKGVYTLLPVAYIFLGICAIGAGLFLEHWSWVVPYLAIIGCMCLHAAIAVIAARWGNSSGRPTTKSVSESARSMRQ